MVQMVLTAGHVSRVWLGGGGTNAWQDGRQGCLRRAFPLQQERKVTSKNWVLLEPLRGSAFACTLAKPLFCHQAAAGLLLTHKEDSRGPGSGESGLWTPALAITVS